MPTGHRTNRHSTRVKTPYAVDNRKSNIGRPEVNLMYSARDRETTPDDGVALRPRTRVWVEGEIILAEWDGEAHDLKDTLAPIFKQLSHRPDETGVPVKDAIVICEQVLQSDYDDNAKDPTKAWRKSTINLPRRYARRTSRRWTGEEIHTYICVNPGKTLYELCQHFYPDNPTPERMENSLRVALNRLQNKGKVEYRKASGQPARWYGDKTLAPDWSACTKAFATELAKIFGGDPAEYAEDAKGLEALVQHNLKLPTHKDTTTWVHPDESPF